MVENGYQLVVTCILFNFIQFEFNCSFKVAKSEKTSFIFLYHFYTYYETFPVQVNIKNGIIEGITLSANSTHGCNIFLGIPYANPPVGALRFRVGIEMSRFLTDCKNCLMFARNHRMQIHGRSFWKQNGTNLHAFNHRNFFLKEFQWVKIVCI